VVPILVTLVVIVQVVQPLWVIESLDLLTSGHASATVANPVDVLLIPFALMAGLALRRAVRGRPRSLPLWIGAVLVVGGLMSLAVHPSLRGSVIVFRLVAGLGIIWVLAQFSKEEFVWNLALPVMVVAALEGLLAIAQLTTDSAVLPGWIGAGAPVTIDGVQQAAGTFGHAHEIATLGLIAVALGIAAYRTMPRLRRRLWLIPLSLAAIPVAISFSRAALLAAVLIVAVLLSGMAGESTNWWPVLAAVAIGLVIPAASFAGGWASRVEQSTGDAEESGFNSRTEQLEQAWGLIESDWLIGVGPGLYSATLEDRVDLDPSGTQPIHNVPLYITVEDGVVVGGLLVLIAAGLAVQALRRSTENRALFLAPVAFLIFDHLLYTAPVGLVMLSLWLGGLAALESRPEL
jgi:hypothetical protein